MNEDSLENSNFERQYPEVPAGVAIAPAPEKMELWVSAYLDYLWISTVQFQPFQEIFRLIRLANTHMRHHSLDTAVEIKLHTVIRSTINISSVVPNDLLNFGDMINATVNMADLPQGHSHLYLTVNDNTTNLGLGVHDSLCDQHPSTPRAIVNWRESTEKSAVTLGKG